MSSVVAARTVPDAAAGDAYSRRDAYVLLTLLAFAYAVSFLDRTVIVLLLEPIKQHYGVADYQLGILHGLGFVLFYLMLGLPIGRLVDRRRRTTILFAGSLVWSIMTASCGLAPSFLLLIAARLGVGAGEATLGPGAVSLVGDAFSADDQPRALAIYSMGIPLGSGLALIGGGALLAVLETHSLPQWTGLSSLAPWQLVCIAASIPGFLVAACFLLVKEPPRSAVRASEREVSGALRSVPVREVTAYVRTHKRAYLAIIGGFSLVILAGYGVGTWIPTFLLRTYGLALSEIGTAYGAISVVTGLVGAALASKLSSILAARNVASASLVVLSIALLGSLIVTPLYALAPSAAWALGFLAVNGIFGGFPFGAAAAAISQMTPGQMRGQLSAVFHLAINAIGVGLGPILVGIMSDAIFTGEDGIRYAIVTTSSVVLPIALLLIASSRSAFLRARGAAEAWGDCVPRPED